HVTLGRCAVGVPERPAFMTGRQRTGSLDQTGSSTNSMRPIRPDLLTIFPGARGAGAETATRPRSKPRSSVKKRPSETARAAARFQALAFLTSIEGTVIATRRSLM